MRIFTAVYVVLLATVSYGAIALFSEGIVVPDISLLLLLSFLTLSDYVLKSWRWKILLGHYGMDINFVESVKTYLAGLFFVVTPAKAGGIVKAELMKKRHGFSRKKVGFVVVVERVFDILAHLVIGGATALLVARQYIASLWGVVVFFAAGLGALYLFRRKLDFVREEIEELKDAGLVASGMILSLVSWLFENIQLWIAVLYLGGNITVAQALFAFSASVVFGNLTFLPGGLGATEATSMGILVLFGVGKGLASSVTLITRLTTLWLGFVLGAVFWFLLFHKK